MDEDGDEREESVKANVLRLESGRGDRTRIAPVLSRFVRMLAHDPNARRAYAEPNAVMVRASTEVYNKTCDDKQGYQENCSRPSSVNEIAI